MLTLVTNLQQSDTNGISQKMFTKIVHTLKSAKTNNHILMVYLRKCLPKLYTL